MKTDGFRIIRKNMCTTEHSLPTDINSLNYFDLIGIVKETNRPPGGIDSIIEIAQNAFLNKDSTVLEIGTSTGFTAIELARLSKCRVVAIDLNQESLDEGKRRAAIQNVDQFITFEKQDASALTYKDEMFDVVFCGNVTSYLNNKSRALKEFMRMLKPNGFIAAIPMYYLETPPLELVDKISHAINHKISVQFKNDWIDFFDVKNLSLFKCADYKFDSISHNSVKDFVDLIFKKDHLNKFNNDELVNLKDRYHFFLNLFRENLALMGFSILLFRKTSEPNDPVLFTSKKIKT